MDFFKTLRNIAVFSLFLSFSSNSHAQDIPVKDEKTADDSIHFKVQILPEFPGGMAGFHAYVSQSYRVPASFKGSGNIILSFVVERDGSLTDIKIIRDLGFGTGDEGIRILKISPKWKPGIQDGIPVRVNYTLPIKLSVK
ncbi:energy transducer TonB [uncultured Flavobacterium sp.]|uniref:energy transducer TonB n=1 Tax=uncultured Flavobacterium sp. TaxID=165435 RepID=UPI0025D544C3|nr:energy transducer TonB [uncultured Flavobacterium sp.]